MKSLRFAALLLGLTVMLAWGFSGPAHAAPVTLSPAGVMLAPVLVDPAGATVSVDVTTGGAQVAETYVIAREASTGRLLQRNAEGWFVGWDGREASLINNGFPVGGEGVITFKVIENEDLTARLMPFTITLAWRSTDGMIHKGSFELRDKGGM